MTNTLGNRITFTSLIKYTFPTIVMMVFSAFYTIVDGIFISRFVSANALAATNVVYPMINILYGISIMFATGGSAYTAKLMGEGRNLEAKKSFSNLTFTSLIISIILGIFTIIFRKPIIYLLGSSEILYDDCNTYLVIMMFFTPVIVLKTFFDYFLVTAGKAQLGLISSVAGGITNIILDYIFIVPLNMGLSGAAYATCIGYTLPCIIGFIYFIKKDSSLHFVKTPFNKDVILKSCLNGSSEMVTQLSTAITTFLFNIVLIKYLGEQGIAAITIILYVQYLLVAAFLGFTSGVSPRISYNYGSQNKIQLRNLVFNSYIFIFIISILTFAASIMFDTNLIEIFSGRETDLYYITLEGFEIFAFSFLLSGFNIFTTGMFTAFSNGKVSALLSLLRTFIFFVLGILFLPMILNVTGVWLVVPFAEVLTSLISIFFIISYSDKYGYKKESAT